MKRVFLPVAAQTATAAANEGALVPVVKEEGKRDRKSRFDL